MDKLVSTFDRVKAKLAPSKDKKKEKPKETRNPGEVEYSVSVDVRRGV